MSPMESFYDKHFHMMWLGKEKINKYKIIHWRQIVLYLDSARYVTLIQEIYSEMKTNFSNKTKNKEKAGGLSEGYP